MARCFVYYKGKPKEVQFSKELSLSSAERGLKQLLPFGNYIADMVNV